jgi:hypothetical protein
VCVMKGGGLEELGGEEESCGCMCIELENMPQDTSNILVFILSHFLGGLP